MRPLLLVAEGFSAFRERVEIDFDGVDFFVLVGPTGAGKSSVVDAICFALYGSVPRYEDERAVAPVITVGASVAKVSLRFELSGETYIATRVVRRLPKGTGATTREARLERVTGATTEVLAGTADELNAASERLIGVSFKHFTRSVVLPQGEFARFLHDKPAERQSLLVSLLDIDIYNTMGQRARASAEALKSDLALREARLARLSSATPEAVAQAGLRIDAIARLRGQIAKTATEVETLEASVRESDAATRQAARHAGLLAAVAVPPQVSDAGGELRRLDKEATAARLEVEKAEELRRRAEAALSTLPDPSELRVAEDAHRAAARLATDLEAASHEERNAITLAASAEIPADAAESSLREATEKLDALREAHSAAELAAHLRVGDDCPVCLQPVGRLPSAAKPASLGQAEQAVRAASETSKRMASALSRAQATLAGAETKVKTLVTNQAEALARAGPWPDLAKLTIALEEVRAWQAELETGRLAERTAREALHGATDVADSVRSSLAAAWNAFDAQRDPVVALGPPRPERNDLLADWSALAAWALAARPEQTELAERCRAAATSAQSEVSARLRQLADGCAVCGIEAQAADGVVALREAAAGAANDAEHQLRTITEGLAERERLTAEQAALAEEAEVAHMLGNLLTANGFQRWLVAEALDLLVEGASATLMGLSGGQYSLMRDGRNEFVVVDHRNADEQRSAKSLSGGETFQASLALALALADQLSGLSRGGAARLESIFLDEGFGTLDPETLAVVADAIESLGSGERMVGVVTHVRELADRVPVRYEVRKGLRTSTVERVIG
jgi:DNA repair protein SbcC/Rad50